MFYGAGAGGPETASAVLGDLVSAAKRHLAGGPGLYDSTHANLKALPVQFVNTRFQITLEVTDKAGVLAKIASIFADHGVSVETVQQSVATNKAALLTIMTHVASEKDLEEVVASLKADDSVVAVASVIRVEGL
jgi:homoserine dehydrogenase